MSTFASRSAVRPLAILMSLTLAIAGLSIPALSAVAAPEAATASSLTWGFKSSWRGYVSGFGGAATVSDGAGTSPDYTWPASSATFDPATGQGSADFGGAVQWVVAAHGIDITLSDPRVVLAGDGTGSLYWTIGAEPEVLGATLSSVAIGGPTSSGGFDSYAVTAAVTVTADGGAAFGGSYAAGTALDALSFSVSAPSAPAVTATTTTVSANPEATAEAGAAVTLTATVAPAAAGMVQFRDGSVALGDPIAVTAGVATTTTSALAAGDHSITAEFASTDAAFGSSTSEALLFAITTPSSGGGGVPEPEPVDGLTVDDATLDWGYSGYAQSGIFGPWRFFGATGDAVVTTGSATGYAAGAGTSMPVSVTDPQVVRFTGGTGSVDTETGAALLSYDGSFTINAYPNGFGAPDETYADPIVAVSADGSGTVSFLVSFGAGADFVNGGTTPAVDLGRVVLATFSATDAGAAGFTVTPSYQGRSYDAPANETQQYRDCPVWGSWPTDFVDELPASVRSHYYSTLSCSTQQAYKPALPLAIGYSLPAPLPVVTASPTTNLESGDVVTVRGENFGPDETGAPLGTRPPLNGKFGGVYVTFGAFLDVWKPSAGAPSAARKLAPGTTSWVVNAEDVAAVGGAARGGVAIEPDGSFEIDIVVTEDFAGALADGNYGIYTYPGGGAVDPRFETYTPIAFAEETTPTTPPAGPGAAPSGGSLLWGVKSSFRDYVVGPIAKGSVTSSGGAGISGGAYWFPQSSAAGDGTSATYRGAVTFTGHAGVLNLRLADPAVRVTSSTAGVLSVVAGGTRVDFATLNLAAATVTTDATGARSYANAPATLTAAGAANFEGFYAAGAALDPVSFTIGSANGTAGTSTTRGTVFTPSNTADATPPATEGIESTTTGGYVAGTPHTFTAAGFQPNETGILVVVYSTPTVLATDATADAGGVVTWTGVLPAGLTGKHTLTFQGSVDRGIVLDIAAAAVVGCPVEDAELRWGFKESFRAYIDGSIANGEWTTAGGATYETPLFGWAGGAGGFDAQTEDADLAFSGSVRFTGHGGVLDTTIANPRVVVDGDRAVILLDVSGTTQEGNAVSTTGVEFAELDLAAADRTGGGDLVAFTGIPAILTEAGAAAFGTYEAGSQFDPVDLSIAVGDACLETASLAGAPDAAPEVEAVADSSPVLWIALAVVLALVLAVVATLLLRRGRSTA